MVSRGSSSKAPRRSRGYEVHAVADGIAAWEELKKADGPRLALLDWMMPGMTGLALCEKLKQSTEMPYVYVILLTSKSSKEDIVQGLDAGADDFLTKPVSSSELRSRLAVGVRILSVISPMASPGPHVEGYEIIGPLGKGADIVYRAIQNGTRREVALKLIRIERVNEDEKARFLREVELTAKLDHPSIVRHLFELRSGRRLWLRQSSWSTASTSRIGSRRRTSASARSCGSCRRSPPPSVTRMRAASFTAT